MLRLASEVQQTMGTVEAPNRVMEAELDEKVLMPIDVMVALPLYGIQVAEHLSIPTVACAKFFAGRDADDIQQFVSYKFTIWPRPYEERREAYRKDTLTSS